MHIQEVSMLELERAMRRWVETGDESIGVVISRERQAPQVVLSALFHANGRPHEAVDLLAGLILTATEVGERDQLIRCLDLASLFHPAELWPVLVELFNLAADDAVIEQIMVIPALWDISSAVEDDDDIEAFWLDVMRSDRFAIEGFEGLRNACPYEALMRVDELLEHVESAPPDRIMRILRGLRRDCERDRVDIAFSLGEMLDDNRDIPDAHIQILIEVFGGEAIASAREVVDTIDRTRAVRASTDQ